MEARTRKNSVEAFTYNNEIYVKVIPTKPLFKSTMVHQVVNRGDIFAIRLSDQALTILPGTIQVTFIDYEFTPRKASKATGNKPNSSASFSKQKQLDLYSN